MNHAACQQKQSSGMKNSKTPYILGIDVGTSSIGWAAVSLESEKPAGILKMGVRRFEAGVSGDIESGNDASLPKQISFWGVPYNH